MPALEVETSSLAGRYSSSVDAQHHLEGKLLFALVASAAAGILFWNTWPIYPFKLLVVLMHESGHAAATLLTGGSVERIAISPNEGGVTYSLYPPSLLRQIIISSAGYIGSTVSGCVLLWIAARAKEGRWPLIALVGACALALGLLAKFGASWLRRTVLVFLAAFSCSYALYDIRDDLLHLTGPGGSDADALARATFIPAIVWGVAWGLLSVALVAVTLRRILVSRASPEPGAAVISAGASGTR
jgi:hypothetical protein